MFYKIIPLLSKKGLFARYYGGYVIGYWLLVYFV